MPEDCAQNSDEKKPLRFSLQMLFYVTTLVIGSALVLAGHGLTGITLVAISAVFLTAMRESATSNLDASKTGLLPQLGLVLVVLVFACYQWWSDGKWEMTLLLAGIISLGAAVRWVRAHPARP